MRLRFDPVGESCYGAPTLRRLRTSQQGRGRWHRLCSDHGLVGSRRVRTVEYLNQVSSKGRDGRRGGEGGERRAIRTYEYTAAVAYLHKAREEGGYAEYQIAIEYGRRSESWRHSESDRCREGYDGHDGCGRDGCGRRCGATGSSVRTERQSGQRLSLMLSSARRGVLCKKPHLVSRTGPFVRRGHRLCGNTAGSWCSRGSREGEASTRKRRVALRPTRAGVADATPILPQGNLAEGDYFRAREHLQIAEETPRGAAAFSARQNVSGTEAPVTRMAMDSR